MNALDSIVTHGAMILGFLSLILAFYTLRVSANKNLVEKLREKLDHEIQERLLEHASLREEIRKLKEK